MLLLFSRCHTTQLLAQAMLQVIKNRKPSALLENDEIKRILTNNSIQKKSLVRQIFKIMASIFSVLLVIVLAVFIFMQQPEFGKSASGNPTDRIHQSSNFVNGHFINQSFTPVMAKDVSIFKIIKDGIFNRSKHNKPTDVLPSHKTNLFNLNPKEDLLIWFGHSSYFMQVDGKKILVDPVLSGNASPVSFMVKSFHGSDIYNPEEIPEIDYLFITHDHWDHMDFKTILKLKFGKIFTGIGNGSHLESWGIKPNQFVELDWNEQSVPDSGFVITATPARHFSGRSFKRNQSIWCSFVLQTPSKKIFIGGDSGFDTHFAKIGIEHGPFDLAILECGQYNDAWRYIHMMPEQTFQAALDLKANILMPVHWGKFALSYHAWDEPIKRAIKESYRLKVPIIHPMIGAELNLNVSDANPEWWLEVK